MNDRPTKRKVSVSNYLLFGKSFRARFKELMYIFRKQMKLS